jgi:hypothetical protein
MAIELEVGSGEPIVQVEELTDLVVTERNMRLPKVAAALASVGDLTNFKHLLLPCASYLDAAYRVCSLLAQVYPDQAAAVAEEVANAAY